VPLKLKPFKMINLAVPAAASANMALPLLRVKTSFLKRLSLAVPVAVVRPSYTLLSAVKNTFRGRWFTVNMPLTSVTP
jgi:hypothetical protein